MIIIPWKLQATDATHITAPFTDIMDNKGRLKKLKTKQESERYLINVYISVHVIFFLGICIPNFPNFRSFDLAWQFPRKCSCPPCAPCHSDRTPHDLHQLQNCCPWPLIQVCLLSLAFLGPLTQVSSWGGDHYIHNNKK